MSEQSDEQRYRHGLRIVGAAGLSALGSDTTRYALILHLFVLGNESASLIGLMYMGTVVPAFFLTAIGGALAERFELRRTLLLADLVAIPLVLVLTNATELWAFIAVTVVLAGVESAAQPAFASYMARIAPPSRLGSLNGLLSSSMSAVHIGAPLLAGLLYAKNAGLTNVLIFDAATYGLAVVNLLFMPALVPEGGKTAMRLLHDIRQGFRYVASHRSLVFIVIAAYVSNLFGDGLVGPMIRPFVADAFGGGASAFSYVMAAFGGGAVVGGLFAGTLAKRVSTTVIVRVCAVAEAIAALGLAFAPNLELAIAAVGLWGLAKVPLLTALITYVQKHAARAFLGRAMSVYQLRRTLPIFIGTAFVSALGDGVTATHFLLYSGGAFLVISVVVQVLGAGLVDLSRLPSDETSTTDEEPKPGQDDVSGRGTFD